MTRNPYDIPDPFEICDRIDAEDERLSVGRGLAPASRSLAAAPATQVPDVTEFARQMPVRRRDQWLAKRQIEGVGLYTELQRATKTLVVAFDEKEEAKRKAILNQTTFEAGLPHLLEKHKRECQTQVVEAGRIYAAAVDVYKQERTDAGRTAAIRAQQFTNHMLRLSIEEEELAAALERAPEVGARRADAKVAAAEVEVARNLAEAFGHRAKGKTGRTTRKEEERRARQEGDEAREARDTRAGFSRPMREQMARHEVINNDRRRAQADIEAIYLRAAREGRQLSDDELEEVDALRDSLKAAETVHKTSAASDLGLEDER